MILIPVYKIESPTQIKLLFSRKKKKLFILSHIIDIDLLAEEGTDLLGEAECIYTAMWTVMTMNFL